MTNCKLFVFVLICSVSSRILNRFDPVNDADADNESFDNLSLSRSKRDLPGFNRLGNTVNQGNRHRNEDNTDSKAYYNKLLMRYGYATNTHFRRYKRRTVKTRYY